jgi:hypothetical protein
MHIFFMDLLLRVDYITKVENVKAIGWDSGIGI